jgi:putative ABC transport system substrate-binding protein
MDRRVFVAAIVGALGVQLPTSAQQGGNKRRIGFLSLAPGPATGLTEPASTDLRALGWIEGQNLMVDRRYASGRAESLGSMAEELVRLKVDVIVANGTSASLAAKRATSSIPIIIDRSGDPVGAGLVASLARPGGNVTGISTMSVELDLKRLELLRELLPSAKRFGVLTDPTNPIDRFGRNNMEQAFRSLQMTPVFVDVSLASELESAVAKVAQQRGQGLIVSADPLFVSNFSMIASAAEAYSLPLMIETPTRTMSGALVSYGPSWTQQNQQLAALVDKVLKGVKPADLPIEQPTQLYLVINLKSAKTLGVTVPRSLLLRADEVVE